MAELGQSSHSKDHALCGRLFSYNECRLPQHNCWSSALSIPFRTQIAERLTTAKVLTFQTSNVRLPFFLFSLILVCETIGIATTPGLLCQPRVIVKMIVEKQMECRLAGETEVRGENLSQRHFRPSQNPTWPDPGLNPGRRGGKPATICLS
jgi:hypothetical protein